MRRASRPTLEDISDYPSDLKGALAEVEAYRELLRQGYRVYLPITHTGDDCVVQVHPGKHVDVEVKSREKGHRIFHLGTRFRPRKNFFVILHFYGTPHFWVLPSAVANKHCTGERNQIELGDRRREQLRNYYNSFNRLEKSD